MYATGSPQTEVNLYRYPVKCAFPVKRSSQKVQLHRLRNTGSLCTGICVFFGLVFWCCFRCALVQGCITKDPTPEMASHHNNYQHEVGVIVVGDLKSGKSTLIQRFIHGSSRGPPANDMYKPTSFDKFYASKQISRDLAVNFTIWDTSGAPAYDSVRPLAYREADVFLVCFSVVEPISLFNVTSHWLQAIRKHRPDAPIVLCGCMASLR